LQHHYNELKEKYASPIKMFVGGLRKGRPYNSIRPESFKTPEQTEWEIYNQLIEKKNKEREKIKQQSFVVEFEEWSNLLSEKEINELLSEETKKSLPSLSPAIKAKIIKNTLLYHFENYIWPINYKKIISNKNNVTL